MNWRRIIGAIAALWGAGVVISVLVGFNEIRGGAYGAGQIVGVIFGFFLLAAGLHAAIPSGKAKDNEGSDR